MKSIKLRAFAKANVSLNITGRNDGMHELDSIMLSLDVFDVVTVTERNDKNIAVSFINAEVDPVNNTAYRAAKAVQDKINCNGFDIVIEKRIPIGAGLGGSSADGAAVIRALDIFYGLTGLDVNVRELALSVGSDVPFMLTGGSARVCGKGEDLYFFKNKLELFAIGVMDEFVSTVDAYKTFDVQNPSNALSLCDNGELCELLMMGDKKALQSFSNGLTEAANILAPSVKRNLEKISSVGGVPCLTGSGGMVLGWFSDIEEFATACSVLRGEKGFRAFTTTNIGIIHEWLHK